MVFIHLNRQILTSVSGSSPFWKRTDNLTFENVRMAIKLAVRVQRGLGESLLRTRQNSQLTCIGYFVILSYGGFHARQTSPETR